MTTRIVVPLPRDVIASKIRARVAISESGCWEWSRTRNEQGYGRLYIGRRHYAAHRLSAHVWVEGFNYADFPLMVCHHCDNPPCVNPSHLFIGTASDNMRDARRKGRISKPSAPPPTIYPRTRACDMCGEPYAPDPSHRGRSVVCSRACLSAWRSQTQKGRGAKLTPQQVEQARTLVMAGGTYRAVGAQFGITAGGLHRALRRQQGDS